MNNVQRISRNNLSLNQEDPSLSGNGQKIALIVSRNGRPTVELKDLRTGKTLPLRDLSRFQPHSSPSLSWNGRYLAVIAQKGARRIVIIEDRLTGRRHNLPLPGERIPIRLSLSPDGTKIALQIAQGGKWSVELFDLTKRIEPDRPRSVIGSDGDSDL